MLSQLFGSRSRVSTRPRRRRIGSRRMAIESLEVRAVLDGSCFVSVVDGDMAVKCDDAANGVHISQVAPGEYLVEGWSQGQVGTSINGSPPNGSFLATGVDNDVTIDMAQRGDDFLRISGPFDVPGDLRIAQHEADVEIYGRQGLVEVHGDTHITGTHMWDSLTMEDALAFRGDVRLDVGGWIYIESWGSSTGAVFTDGDPLTKPHGPQLLNSPRISKPASVEITSSRGVVIGSHDTSTAPRFEVDVDINTVGDAFIVAIDSYDYSTGPVFEGDLEIDAIGIVGINSWGTGTGPVFKSDVKIAAGRDVLMRGATFEEPLKISAKGNLSIYSAPTSSTSAPFANRISFQVGGDVLIQSSFNFTSTLFSHDVSIRAGGNVEIKKTKFAGNVKIQLGRMDNVLKVTDSIFEGDFAADGGAGIDTYVDGGGNVFQGEFDLFNFE